MSPKRGDRAAPPPAADEWDTRFGTSDAAKGWDHLCRHARANTRDAWQLLRTTPRTRRDSRHTRLRYELATVTLGGRALEQWQIEVTGGGRIWYAIDDERRTVWITHASTRHPRETE